MSVPRVQNVNETAGIVLALKCEVALLKAERDALRQQLRVNWRLRRALITRLRHARTEQQLRMLLSSGMH